MLILFIFRDAKSMFKSGTLNYICLKPRFLKNILSIFLVILILLQSFNKTWIVFSFKINQDYISKVLCINRDKPEMHCNGKCVLAKRVEAEEQKEKSELPQKLKKQYEVLYCIEQFSPSNLAMNVWAAKPVKSHFQNRPFTSPFFKGIFQPPDFVTT